VMTNLIGEDVLDYAAFADAGLHLYGKADVKAGRKMGHVNRISPKE
ncbi:MAG: 5-(carboxyamino)imidazole ribonucleotide synthase, partial [Rhodospirillaceae bacterium]|nr:5-(carboxyamino)imidazole ribonucleotide synthase [Rhodospirillaceae bacterium]